MKRWKAITAIIAGFAVVFLIIWMSPIGKLILAGGLDEQPFDSQQWKAVKDKDLPAMRVRLTMVDDLMENQLNNSMDSVRVKELLGEPDRQYGFSYSLGELTSGIDPLFLILTFDENGKLNKRDIEPEGKLKKGEE